jgi:hypothetical protein
VGEDRHTTMMIIKNYTSSDKKIQKLAGIATQRGCKKMAVVKCRNKTIN